MIYFSSNIRNYDMRQIKSTIHYSDNVTERTKHKRYDINCIF